MVRPPSLFSWLAQGRRTYVSLSKDADYTSKPVAVAAPNHVYSGKKGRDLLRFPRDRKQFLKENDAQQDVKTSKEK